MEFMKLSLLFFDHSDKIEDYRRIINEKTIKTTSITIETYFVKSDVRDLVKKFKVDCIVSPANSIGFMDGGIDMFYMQMFPGIQNDVQDRIKTFGITTVLGRYALPVGSAMLVKTKDKQTPLMMCVPTMFLPRDIRGTKNVYWAMRGLLKLAVSSFNKESRIVLAIPCFGTGVGRMTGEASAQQINEALQDFEKAVDVKLWTDVDGKLPAHAYVLTEMACEQHE